MTFSLTLFDLTILLGGGVTGFIIAAMVFNTLSSKRQQQLLDEQNQLKHQNQALLEQLQHRQTDAQKYQQEAQDIQQKISF